MWQTHGARRRQRRAGKGPGLVLNPSTLKTRRAERVPSSPFPEWGSRGKEGGENRQLRLQEQGTVGQVQETRGVWRDLLSVTGHRDSASRVQSAGKTSRIAGNNQQRAP